MTLQACKLAYNELEVLSPWVSHIVLYLEKVWTFQLGL